MTRVSFELDEDTFGRVERLAQARQMSVEELLRRRAEDIARLAPISIENRSHRKIVSALDRGPDDYGSSREEIYDREKLRAEVYVRNRRLLLELIDRTEGDMGGQAWNRQSIYER